MDNSLTLNDDAMIKHTSYVRFLPFVPSYLRFQFMSDSPIFDKKALIKHINTLLDPTRDDMKSTPDMSWLVPMTRDYLFLELLQTTNGNQTKAARILGVTRNTYALHLTRINDIMTDE